MQHVVRRVRPHARPVRYPTYETRTRLHTEHSTTGSDDEPAEDFSDTTIRKHVSGPIPRDPLDQVRISPNQPTFVGDNGQRTYRLRKHGNKPLPIPEIMDPIYLEARDKYKQTKPPPASDPAELTPFQRNLALNPFARALATPLRQCRLTQVRLPSHFLAQFEQVTVESENTFVPYLRRGGNIPAIAAKSHVLENPEVIEQLKVKYKMLIPEKKRSDRWKWDKDMKTVYLQELREATLRPLGMCFESGIAKSLEDVNDEDDVAFLIQRTGSEENKVEGSQAMNQTNASETTWDMYEAMSDPDADIDRKDMPKVLFTYDLRKLFPQEAMDQFTSQHELKNGKAVFMKAKMAQVAQMYLEKLQYYVEQG